MKLILKIFLVILLTILTQIGGVALLLSDVLCKKVNLNFRFERVVFFVTTYTVFTFVILPLTAPLFGRERVANSAFIQPTNYMSIFLNRNYVRPEMNKVLKVVSNDLKDKGVRLNYLDANFPFINKFPLLPHLSHNDGKKLDLSLVFENQDGEISKEQKSRSGYGVFEEPTKEEYNQIEKCLDNGYFQYDYPKYLTLGSKNDDLTFSERGTKLLVESILKQRLIGKIFIEPHLRKRLNLIDARVRYHGCRAVRHDDHIHLQLR